MADKRMLTKKVTDSDSFIALPSSTQALYMHLNQGADDDGFNNQVQMAMFKAHASVDDVKLLITKRFIIQFDSGVIVIKHWRMANALRKDRYTPTAFKEELDNLQIKDNNAYTEKNDGCQVVAKWLPSGCHSIGKDSIDKVSIGKDCSDFTLENVKKYVAERGNKIDPEKFFNYYGDGVEDWKAKVEEWERTQFKRPTNQSTHKDDWATYNIEAWEKKLLEKAYG